MAYCLLVLQYTIPKLGVGTRLLLLISVLCIMICDVEVCTIASCCSKQLIILVLKVSLEVCQSHASPPMFVIKKDPDDVETMAML